MWGRGRGREGTMAVAPFSVGPQSLPWDPGLSALPSSTIAASLGLPADTCILKVHLLSSCAPQMPYVLLVALCVQLSLFSVPGCSSLPLLQVWMNGSISTSWLSDFHSDKFSVSSGCYSASKLLLFQSRLCVEVWCVHLCLHLAGSPK
ncbi:hypothetical protein HJG60_007960 [Phyllostomus discolor]|uniref:Uncharacterized protein n=1 Tax=Phyllostomus discolor TaxID=89673 RepID=A0A834EVU2_9CHIR|nr:hypothetical protein HJG60_007960 [Phyllostomus discolor]